jgi:hypothetical protein
MVFLFVHLPVEPGDFDLYPRLYQTITMHYLDCSYMIFEPRISVNTWKTYLL